MKNKYKCNILWDTERIRVLVKNTFSLGITYEYGLISICLVFLKIDLVINKVILYLCNIIIKKETINNVKSNKK